ESAPQPHIAKIEKQQDQFRSQARVPLPVRSPHGPAPQRPGHERGDRERGADRCAAGGDGVRHLHPPDEADGRRDRHGHIHHEGHPCTGGMYVDDAETVALLVIGGREHQPAPQSAGDEERRRPREPRRQAAGERVHVRRRGETVEPGPVHESPRRYSRLMRTAAAAASGASVTPSTAKAPSSSSGARYASPAMASCVARAPKISTGSDSGSVSSDSSAPERFMPSVSAAPIEPIRLRATLPTATDATIPATAAAGAPSDSAASGAMSASGRPVSSQCAALLANMSAVSDWPDSAYCSSVPS